jgi:flagellar motor switch protein FliG
VSEYIFENMSRRLQDMIKEEWPLRDRSNSATSKKPSKRS